MELDPTMEGNETADKFREEFGGLISRLEGRIKVLERYERNWCDLENRMKEYARLASNKITLDIGGQRFAASKETLLSQKGTFFDCMLSSGHWKPDSDGVYFIDRSPELFPLILEFLRTGKVNIKKYSYDVLEDLRVELDFYQVGIPAELLSFKGSNILNGENIRTLLEWIGNKQANLIYTGNRDGFSAPTFHKMCDNKGPTLAIIKSTKGYVFGGYASQAWERSQTCKYATECWIFSLINPHNIEPQRFFPLPLASTMYCSPEYCVTFGNGHDIHISDNANKNDHSYTNFPYAYADTTGQGNTLFTGERHFVASEVEVFQIVNRECIN